MVLRSLVVAILTISTSAGCAGSERPAMEPVVGGAERVATVQSDHALPSSSLSDWRTYGMRLVSATVLGEDALPVEPAFEAVGEGSIGRTVDLKIGDVHWRADDTWGASVDLPPELTLVTEGWIFGEFGRRPIRDAGGSRLEVGATYVLLLTQMSPDVTSETTGEPWTILLPHGALALVDGTVEVPPDNPLADELYGRTPDELAEMLTSSTVVPSAEPYLQLPPFDRYLAATGQTRE